MMNQTKRTYVARTIYGEFSRVSVREYAFCIARKDGWYQFSLTQEAATRELRYQERRGREVVMVPVSAGAAGAR